MLTNPITAVHTTGSSFTPETVGTALSAQKVVIVNGSPEILELLETVLDAGHYDIVFVESADRAYSQIKKVRPNLVILCMHLEEAEGFHVLSMLKLDDETRGIPVLTYATEAREDEEDAELAEAADDEILRPKPALRMN